MIDQHTLLNCIRSLYNIDGYLLPELTAEHQIEFVRDPVRYFIGTDKAQQDGIYREVMKRQPTEPAYAGIPMSDHARTGVYGWHPGDEA